MAPLHPVPMKWDQGLGIIGMIVLATALALLLTTAIPISVSKETVELKDWLGFAGNVLGAGVALGAAVVAWKSVQDQISAQRDAMLLDMASRQLDRAEQELHALTVCCDLAIDVLRVMRADIFDHNRVQELQAIGLKRSEVETRRLIQTKVGGPIAPVTLHRFGFLFTEILVVLMDIALASEAAALRLRLKSSCKRLEELLEEKLKRGEILREKTLPTYLLLIDSGLEELHG